MRELPTSAMAFRSSGIRAAPEFGPLDLAATDFRYQLGEIAAAGGDIRP
jgi:hypothetical protein